MSQPESQLSRKIIAKIRDRGGFAFKIQGGPTMMAGVPDIIICYRGLFLGVETKLPSGQVSQIQKHVHGQIRAAGGTVVVVRSEEEADRLISAIDAIATRLGLPPAGPQRAPGVSKHRADTN